MKGKRHAGGARAMYTIASDEREGAYSEPCGKVGERVDAELLEIQAAAAFSAGLVRRSDGTFGQAV